MDVLLLEQPADFVHLYDEGWQKQSIAGWRSCDACGVQAVETGIEAAQLVGQPGVFVKGSSTLPLVVGN